MIQQHIWKQLYRTKVHSIYLELLHARTETIDRSIKIFLALVSSGGIAGWAIWKEADFIWACAIALAQVITAIRPYLPYRDRLKALSALSRELEELAIYMEIKWLEISAGELTEKEMRKLNADMLRKISSAVQKHFPVNSIPHNNDLMDKAEIMATNYLSTHLYQGEDDE
jgi:hypothetical protein